MDGFIANKSRLSDRILFALDLALQQEDLEIAEMLNRAMELSMTRHTGGGEFVERRDYPSTIEKTLDDLRQLKKRTR